MKSIRKIKYHSLRLKSPELEKLYVQGVVLRDNLKLELHRASFAKKQLRADLAHCSKLYTDCPSEGKQLKVCFSKETGVIQDKINAQNRSITEAYQTYISERTELLIKAHTIIMTPDVNSVWVHGSTGNLYTVLMITNILDKVLYPRTVVYRGANGNNWSRKVSDWHRSMTELRIKYEGYEFVTTKFETFYKDNGKFHSLFGYIKGYEEATFILTGDCSGTLQHTFEKLVDMCLERLRKHETDFHEALQHFRLTRISKQKEELP